jgi:hypothetical protein
MSQVDPAQPVDPPPEWDVKIRQFPPVHPARTVSESTDWERSEYARSITSEPPPNWDVLIRVLQPPVPESLADDDASSILTVEDREKWHQIITTESTLRTMLTEAVVTEDYERIRRDTRFQRVFEPKKWDVIIRVLAAPRSPTREQSPDDSSDSRSERTSNNSDRRPREARSRSSSLAPVQEVGVQDEPIVPARGRYRDPDAWSDNSGIITSCIIICFIN